MNHKGSVFILFLWVLLLLSFFAMSVGFRTRLAAKIEGYELRRFEMNYDFLSAINLARFFIESDKEPTVDFVGDDWYGTPEEFKSMDLAKRFELEISDEGSKIDLNKVSEQFLLTFFGVLKKKGIKLETDPKDLTASILAWRGQTSLTGKATSGFDQKGAPFQTIDELRTIQYISPHDVDVLMPFVTVYGTPFGGSMRVNINTVHPYILEALILQPGLIGGDFDKSTLLQQIEALRNVKGKIKPMGKEKTEPSSKPSQAFQQVDLDPNNFIQRLNLPYSIQMVQLVSQLISFVTIDSEFFSVHVRSKLPKKESFVLDAVLGPRFVPRAQIQGVPTSDSLGRPTGQPVTVPLEILAWQEGVA